MAQAADPHSEMAQARQSEGINVIFDERSPALSRSPSCSRSSSSNISHHSSQRSRGRVVHRGRHRSPSSSSSNSRSTSRSGRSRSHPRCHRHSSRCRCSHHRRYQRGHSRRRSPPRRYRAHSRSLSRSPTVDRYSRRRHYRSRSRPSSHRRSSHSRSGKSGCQLSRSPPRSFRDRATFKSLKRSNALSVEEKRDLLEAAKQTAMKNLGVTRLDLPESVKPILTEQSAAPECVFAGPETRVCRNSQNDSQSTDVQDVQIQRVSPKRGISFSSNNSVAKPTVCTPCAKVTSLVDSVASRKPYGHWIPVRTARH